MSGIVLVTVPIGNHKDITLRALESLKEINYIFAEDTRVFKKLAGLLEINIENKNINSFHDHSEDHKLNNIMKLAKDHKVAFVSDAGSPIISDPAFPIVNKAIEEGVSLSSVGGVSAVNYALELSGLAPTPFHFHGFIPRETSKKNELYQSFSNIYGTHIFFEGVSRVKSTLSELSKLFMDSQIAVAREITKDFESVYRFKGSEYESIQDEIIEKGEFVILVNNSSKVTNSDPKIKELAEEILSKGNKPKLVSKLLSSITGQASKEIYEKLQK